MQNCKSYQDLSRKESTELIGYLVTLVQTSEGAFKAASLMVEAAKETGKLNGVKVGSDIYDSFAVLNPLNKLP